MLDCKGLGRMRMYPKGRTYPAFARKPTTTENFTRQRTFRQRFKNRHHTNMNVQTWRFTKRFGFTVGYIQFTTVL
jgi:hypothetical protein